MTHSNLIGLLRTTSRKSSYCNKLSEASGLYKDWHKICYIYGEFTRSEISTRFCQRYIALTSFMITATYIRRAV